MSWLDIFRKKEEKKIEKISFSRLKEKLENEQKSMEKEKSRIKEEIAPEIADFNLNMKDKMLNLENVNIDAKKEEERIKLIVRENLRHYLGHLNKLTSNLKNSESLKPEDYFKSISQSFYNFNKNSKTAFEKATILIGRELGEIKEEINSASKNIDGILKKSGKNKAGTLEELEKMLTGTDELRNNVVNSENLIKELENKARELEERKKQAGNEIKEMQESEEYKKSEEAKSAEEKEKQEIEKNISKIKQNIDLRYLAKFFHQNRKKSGIIKKYSDNFKQALKEDNNLEIISLAMEAGRNLGNVGEIREKLNEKQVISRIEEKLAEKKKELGELGRQLINMQEDIIKEKDKIKRFNEKISDLMKRIIEKARLLNLEIE